MFIMRDHESMNALMLDLTYHTVKCQSGIRVLKHLQKEP